jgi:transcription antitermination factor NusG
MLLEAIAAQAFQAIPPITHAEEEASWFAVQVFSQQERRVQERLRAMDYDTLLPMDRVRQRQRRGSGSTIVWVKKSTFPGYLFVRESGDTWHMDVNDDEGVIRVLKSGEYPIPLSRRDVCNLVAAARESSFAPGEVVTLTEGPLRGCDVTVLLDCGTKLRIKTTMIGKALELDVPVRMAL